MRSGKQLRLRSRFWIEDDKGKILMGEGRAKILELIESTGSINKTAKKLGMSYRAVWGKLRATEDALGESFVLREGRAGSSLTAEGAKFLRRYNDLKHRCTEHNDRLFEEIYLSEDNNCTD